MACITEGVYIRIVAWICSLLLLCSIHAQQCDKIDSCSCKIVTAGKPGIEAEEQYIDLHPLDGGGTSKFTDVAGNPGSNSKYSWNPCSAFTEGDCADVASCQIQNLVPNTVYHNIGTQDTAEFGVDPTTSAFQISYHHEDSISSIKNETHPNTLRTTIVILQCDQTQEGTLVNVGEQTVGMYYMTLTSKYACPTSAPPSPSSSSLSIGSILCIVFFCALAFYIAAGITFQAGVKHARGSEVIPNKEFWTSLPGLVKDGFKFVASCRKRSGYAKF